MKKNIYFLAIAFLFCVNAAFSETVGGTTYEYTLPVFISEGPNHYTTRNSVQLYSAYTPDANRTKAIRENAERVEVEDVLSQLPTLENYAERQMLLSATPQKREYSTPDMLLRIDKLDNHINEMNKTLMTELKKMNERFDKLSAVVQNQNIKEVNKTTLPLSRQIQKAFAESSTRDLKDIPTAVH